MNPVINPFAPGAGTQPPVLAGRDQILSNSTILLQRAIAGRSHRNLVMVGLRGVGKTVLLDRIQVQAQSLGVTPLWLEADETRSLPAILSPQLRALLIQLSKREAASELARRALRGLAGFVSALKVRYEDLEIGLDLAPLSGLADSGDLTADLQSLFEAVGGVAKAAGTCAAIFVDEIQYVERSELASLLGALHRVAQRRLPIVLIAAGLPSARGDFGIAKSYSERLIEFIEIGRLESQNAGLAISKPLDEAGVGIENSALAEILIRTERYPYFLQEWGKHAWNVALATPITVDDVEQASDLAFADLEAGFFRVRMERVSAAEKTYLRAMAGLGSGPYKSGDIAKAMGREVSAMAPIRRSLINKGMIWSPNRGVAAFTVPMFDKFLRRNISSVS